MPRSVSRSGTPPPRRKFGSHAAAEERNGRRSRSRSRSPRDKYRSTELAIRGRMTERRQADDRTQDKVKMWHINDTERNDKVPLSSRREFNRKKTPPMGGFSIRIDRDENKRSQRNFLVDRGADEGSSRHDSRRDRANTRNLSDRWKENSRTPEKPSLSTEVGLSERLDMDPNRLSNRLGGGGGDRLGGGGGDRLGGGSSSIVQSDRFRGRLSVQDRFQSVGPARTDDFAGPERMRGRLGGQPDVTRNPRDSIQLFDPRSVPKGRAYFSHDDREGERERDRPSLGARGGRFQPRRGFERGFERERRPNIAAEPVWKHDKFDKEVVDVDIDGLKDEIDTNMEI